VPPLCPPAAAPPAAVPPVGCEPPVAFDPPAAMSVPPLLPDPDAPPVSVEPARPPSPVATPPLVESSPALPPESVLVKAGPPQATAAILPVAMNVAANSALGRNRASKNCLSPELLPSRISRLAVARLFLSDYPAETAGSQAKSAGLANLARRKRGVTEAECPNGAISPI